MAASRTKSTLFVCVTMAAFLAAPIQSCPAKCTCEEMQFHRVAVVCEGQGLTSIPLGLPQNTSKLNLSHNNFTVLDFGMLSDLDRLYEVDLSWNEISLFHGSVSKNIITFDLTHNNIECISEKTFKNVFEESKTIHLQENPFNCDCDQWNSDLCDCSENIFSCKCNMVWFQKVAVENWLFNGPIYCQKPAALRNVPIAHVTLKPHECETKYQKIVGGTGGAVALMLAVVAAYVLYKRKMSCHCYIQISEYEQIPGGGQESGCDPRHPNVCHASVNQYQENSGGESVSVNNGETNAKMARGHIDDNEQPSEGVRIPEGASHSHTMQAEKHSDKENRPVSKRLPRQQATSKVKESSF